MFFLLKQLTVHPSIPRETISVFQNMSLSMCQYEEQQHVSVKPTTYQLSSPLTWRETTVFFWRTSFFYQQDVILPTSFVETNHVSHHMKLIWFSHCLYIMYGKQLKISMVLVHVASRNDCEPQPCASIFTFELKHIGNIMLHFFAPRETRLMSDELSLQALGAFANRNIRCQKSIEMLQPLRYSMVGLRTRLHATVGQPATLCWSQWLATAAFPAANGEPCEDDTSWGHSNEDTQTFQFENELHFFEHLPSTTIGFKHLL